MVLLSARSNPAQTNNPNHTKQSCFIWNSGNYPDTTKIYYVFIYSFKTKTKPTNCWPFLTNIMYFSSVITNDDNSYLKAGKTNLLWLFLECEQNVEFYSFDFRNCRSTQTSPYTVYEANVWLIANNTWQMLHIAWIIFH